MALRPALHGRCWYGEGTRGRRHFAGCRSHSDPRESDEAGNRLGRWTGDYASGIPVSVAGRSGTGLALYVAVLGHVRGQGTESARMPFDVVPAEFLHLGSGLQFGGLGQRIANVSTAFA